MTLVGSLKQSKRKIPPEFLPKKTRKENSFLFGFQHECTLVFYCPKKNKAVLIASNMHRDDAINPETKEMVKPEMVIFYNKTKIGVDLVDKM